MTKEQEKYVKDWGIGNYQITEQPNCRRLPRP